jgi:hypothetical protein
MSPVEHSYGRGREVGGEGGAKSYHRDKALVLYKFSILSETECLSMNPQYRLRRSEVTSRMHPQLFLSPNIIIYILYNVLFRSFRGGRGHNTEFLSKKTICFGKEKFLYLFKLFCFDLYFWNN